jgi:hypothetical protein
MLIVARILAANRLEKGSYSRPYYRGSSFHFRSIPLPAALPGSSTAQPSATTARLPNAPAHFVFAPFHRNVPDELLIQDLQRIAMKLRLATFSQAVYRKHSQFSPLTIASRFGGWNAALIKAGLQSSRHFRESPEVVLNDIRRVAAELKTSRLLLAQYTLEGRYSMPVIYRLFKSWQRALYFAGLTPSNYRSRATDSELFDNLKQLWQHLGRQPRCTELKPPHSRFGLTPYQRRFGGYQAALKAFVQFIQSNKDPHAPIAPPPISTPIPTPIHHKTTRHINWRLRFLILRRDHYKCRACGRSPATQSNVRLQVDHIKPWSQGGETIAANLQTLCDRCNIGKCDLSFV